ncbi:MAG TPA: class I adenylate-forming enzyme family protein [Acidimicrobiales bacterium]|nr:class I adenylate-forming enzyme family protein [Acidimicrobiales bacterium]
MDTTYDAAAARVTAPGQRFETGQVDVDGRTYTTFVNAPPTLRPLFASARERGDRDFLVYEDERWSFAEVMAQVDALGHLLVHEHGVHVGDRVAIAMRNYPEWIVSFAAITSIGAIAVALNAWWTADELEYALDDSTPTVLMGDRERIERAWPGCERRGIAAIAVRQGEAEPPAGVSRWEDVLPLGEALPDQAPGPDDDATILYTSGTTGNPKGAVSTHRALVQSLMGFGCRVAIERARTGAAAAPEPEAPADPPVLILVVPLFHVTGLVPVMLSCFAAGVKLVIMYKWHAERALELIERERVTSFVGVPTQSWDLLESPRFAEFDTSSLVSVGGGGAPMPPKMVARVERSFSKGRPSIGYGLTETNAYGPGHSGDDFVRKPTSTGRGTPILQVEVRDEDGNALPPGGVGEIWFKGPHLIRGYWGKPEATAETIVDGWLRTGDLGRVDDEGFVYVQDRLKDIILRGGENVYCAEVEAALYEHPSVLEAAVFGVPHERLGEEVAAAVVPKPGARLTVADLEGLLGAHLAPFKVPSRWLLAEAPLPRNAAGKVLKRSLRDELAS